MDAFIRKLPKVELHLHIEGSLEPELMFRLAERNRVAIPFKNVDEVRAAYDFGSLQDFLDIYYRGAQVLLKEEDFYELALAYLTKAHSQNVRHAEIFFDPQTHTGRGIPFEVFMPGLRRAQVDAEERFGLTSRLILCFLRHLSPDEALATLDAAAPYREWITAVGLDSSEKGRPPELFKAVFDKARAQGYRAVAHAGEEGPADYVWQALRLLGAQRIDHGVRSADDPQLLDYLVAHEIPLTVCPLSNIKLRVFAAMEGHNLRTLLQRGVRVTINSDDPAYFGGYMNENFSAAQQGLGLTRADLGAICRNAIAASFADEARKAQLGAELAAYFKAAP